MRRTLFSVILLLSFSLGISHAQEPTRQHLTIICTTDIHGNYFPYDFVNNTDGVGSMARVHSYVENERRLYGKEGILLLDAGDILQGTPASYYYNYVDATSVHLCAQMMNYMKYDVATIGNHDIETGHGVYDRWTKECNFPIVAANIVDKDGKPYWKPYVVVEKAGLRVAVFGLVTPTIPKWLPERLWSGLEFRDMVETAREYMPKMKEEADVIVGLFHSGMGNEVEDYKEATSKLENATWAVAHYVPGFDVIFCGHDHRSADKQVMNIAGHYVPVLNAGPGAEYVATATRYYATPEGYNIVTVRPFTFSQPETKAVPADKRLHGRITTVKQCEPDKSFMKQFRKQFKAVKKYSQEVIGQNDTQLTTRDAYFGPSELTDYIHSMQLQISGADISFAAPLKFEVSIPAGKLTVGQIFSLYPFENLLYVMRLSGREVKDYLEYSYGGWVRTINTAPSSLATQHMLRFCETMSKPNPADNWKLFSTPSYNFDSAAGLRYIVDVSKPKGNRVTIISLANGEPFDMDKEYRVALNSYRGNGGGGHLVEGARIPKDELQSRILWTTERDLRHYLIEEVRKDGGIKASKLNQWHFEPADILQPLIDNDRKLLFP